MRRGDVQRDILNERTEIFVLGYEIRSRNSLRLARPLSPANECKRQRCPSFVTRDAFLLALAIPLRPQNHLRFRQVAIGSLGQRAFAIHHSRVRCGREASLTVVDRFAWLAFVKR